ncbi:venom metalloproteinase antarease-like TpachMP_A [Centruroides sculpturatus]|uniref:venom metalloproteinase antarease-like TpachMP_A n=1 Tax=Centruroides sculpturatus TaxID=218467 RepID=UPI000C6DCF24|nr:venom metalloproteinase antarease-like TpachMP_A [Centruroides sculpturatus]
MFRYVIAVLFCCPVLAIPGGRTEITYPSLETLRSGEKILTLRAFGNDIALKLESAGDVIADDFTAMDGDGKIHKTDVKNLKRKLFRNKENNAAVYINEEGSLEIKGLIDSRMKIEPCSSNEEIKDGRNAHCITRRSEDDKRIHDAVIPPSIHEIYSSDSLMMMQDDQCVGLDYIFVTESNFTRHFPNSEEIKVYLTMAVMGVQNIMDTLNLRIKVRLIGVTEYNEENEPNYIKQSEMPGHKGIISVNQLIGNMMDYFCQHQNDKGFEKYKKANIIMLITRRTFGNLYPDGNLFTGITGVAPLGAAACDSCDKCGAVTVGDDPLYRDEIIAHESAHLIGSPHDGEGPELSLHGGPGAKACPGSDGFVMGDQKGENKRKFSNCSRENIKYFLSLPTSQCIIRYCKK